MPAPSPSTLVIRGRSLLPIVQGGMGVGVSGHRLAGHVARLGAMGTLASVDLRRLHPDIMQRLRRCRDPAVHGAANVEALDREIRAARAIAGPEGFIAVNVMRALSNYADLVRQACRSGADAIVCGAGLPFDLPDLVEGYPHVALIPILSEERGVRAVMKRWLRRGRLPDAIILEHPGFAGGHLGATRLEDVAHERFDFAHVLPAVREVCAEFGDAGRAVPLIAAGGVNSPERFAAMRALGASAVQLGTAFAVTHECDAHPNFKRVLAEARPEDIVTFISPAGLPARAVLTPFLRRYLSREKRLRAEACSDPSAIACPSQVQCLAFCGFKDGNGDAGQFCIETQLAAAQRGSIEKGLFFRGSESLPFGTQIRGVEELLAHLLGCEITPLAGAAARVRAA